MIALWFFAGFHKLISPGYYLGAVPFMTLHAQGKLAPLGFTLLGVAAAVFELALGVMAALPRTRRLCAVLAVPFHVGVAAWLIFGLHWNESVCPWNLTLAVAGWTLIRPWRTTLAADWRRATLVVRSAVAFVLFSPLLFYVGLMDPFLAYCIYSNNTPEAWIITPDSDKKFVINGILNDRLNVAIPPEHRLYEAYFQRVGRPGDTLVIEDPRWWLQLSGYGHREIEFPAPDSDNRTP